MLRVSARSRRIGGARVLEVRLGDTPRCGRGLLVRVKGNFGVFSGVRRLLHELGQLCVVVSLCRAQIRLESHHVGLQLCGAIRRSVKNHVLLFQKTFLVRDDALLFSNRMRVLELLLIVGGGSGLSATSFQSLSIATK